MIRWRCGAPRRAGDYLSIACLLLAGVFSLIAVSVYAAQPLQTEVNVQQAIFNATTDLRLQDVIRRVQQLESAAMYVMGALVANLSAHLFQIIDQRRRRG